MIAPMVLEPPSKLKMRELKFSKTWNIRRKMKAYVDVRGLPLVWEKNAL